MTRRGLIAAATVSAATLVAAGAAQASSFYIRSGQGAEGVGLLRSEFLFGDRARLPDEDEQLEQQYHQGGDLEGHGLVELMRTAQMAAGPSHGSMTALQ